MQPMVYQQTAPLLYRSTLIRVDNQNAAIFGGVTPVVVAVSSYIPTFRPRRRMWIPFLFVVDALQRFMETAWASH